MKAQYDEASMKLEKSELSLHTLYDELKRKSITESKQLGGTSFASSPVLQEISNNINDKLCTKELVTLNPKENENKRQKA